MYMSGKTCASIYVYGAEWRSLCFCLGFYLQYMGISFLRTPVAHLVGWRVDLRVNLHYPGMEFPIAVVAREIAAYWCLEGQWQIFMGV